MARPDKITDIKDLLKEEFVKEIGSLDIERFRAAQALDWVYKKYVCDFDRMTNLSAKSREILKENYYISDLRLAAALSSQDGAKKFLFCLEDGQKVETVYIPSKKTDTVCVSSQVGCKFACAFCASGKGGFVRDLRSAEIINQVLFLKKEGFNISNVVFMGMGEPLDNYENTLRAVRILNAPYGLGIGQRKITISTCGLIPKIKRLAAEDLQVELSVSLHSADEKTRSGLMAVNKRYPLKELIGACREYAKKTNRQVTFEYVLIEGVNDAGKDARSLAALLKGMLAKINLIFFNAVEGLGYSAPGPDAVKEFKDILDKKGILSTIRYPRGADIDAACGQLRLRNGKI